MATKFYWHIHHRELLELATEPIKHRIAFIKENKPASEQKLRLKLLKLVRGELPKAVLDAGAAFKEADAAWDKAYARNTRVMAKFNTALHKARVVLAKVLRKNLRAINALHKKECPRCPWNGKTIFAKRNKK